MLACSKKPALKRPVFLLSHQMQLIYLHYNQTYNPKPKTPTYNITGIPVSSACFASFAPWHRANPSAARSCRSRRSRAWEQV